MGKNTTFFEKNHLLCTLFRVKAKKLSQNKRKNKNNKIRKKWHKKTFLRN